MTQKQRHFKYFEQLDTIPIDASVLGGAPSQGAVLMNAEGGFGKDEIITWDQWWNRKQITNEELINAISNRDIKTVVNVLNEETSKHGLVADVNVKLMDNSTPLHCAVQAGAVEIVEILLKYFAEVNAQDEEGICPLHLACISSNLAMVKKLLSRPELMIEL